MGLMYIFPVSIEESDRTEIISNNKDPIRKTVVLKTYGLPMVFWSYLAASLIVIGTMWLASKSAIHKLLTYEDASLQGLAYLVQFTLILTPFILLGFFFYEKELRKTGLEIKLVYKVFFIPFYFKNIILDSNDALSVDHFMDSPNMAKIHNVSELKHFENKGYFELHAMSGGKSILIDRHTRKADLLKLKELLCKY
ncbi:MAG: hypothetical protein H7281_05865 [Bacteriovorax sp.]|nr:hypothetical protein [Bacteriovorax sp.]